MNVKNLTYEEIMNIDGGKFTVSGLIDSVGSGAVIGGVSGAAGGGIGGAVTGAVAGGLTYVHDEWRH